MRAKINTKALAVTLFVGLFAYTAVFGFYSVNKQKGSNVESGIAASATDFTILSEVYGDSNAGVEQRLNNGLADGFAYHTVMSNAQKDFIKTNNMPFAYFSIPTEAGVDSCYPSSIDPNTDTLLNGLATQNGGFKTWRLIMPEADQGGGCWATGRPNLSGMSEDQAYSAWEDHLLTTKGLEPYLSQPRSSRNYDLMEVCVFAFCTHYAYEMGIDTVILERNIDEVSDMISGIAMIRGAASQNGGKQWGIDFSTWRFWNNGPTEFYDDGRLKTGWSPSTFKRHMYAAYMAGTNIMLSEAAVYFYSNGSLNPLGQEVKNFNNFASNILPDRGDPQVPIAFVKDHNSGFEPKFGEWMQGPYKWYWKIPYTNGDKMLASSLGIVYPEYNKWGTIIAGAPWKVTNSDGSINVAATQAAYASALANGNDTRQWEPMGSTKWGHSADVITDKSNLDALNNYKVLYFTKNSTLSANEMSNIEQFVNSGGTAVVNIKQLPTGYDNLTGVSLTSQNYQATSSKWTADGSTNSENSYAYTKVVPATASVLATTNDTQNLPLATSNNYGSGRIIVTTAAYMNDNNGNPLKIASKLIESLAIEQVPVRLEGEPLQYYINKANNADYVTLINTKLTNGSWSGRLVIPKNLSTVNAAYDVLSGASINITQDADNHYLDTSVAPYDVKVIKLEQSTQNFGADINGDGKVNIFDLSILLSQWNTANSTSDLNQDKIVNILDLSILLSKWDT